MRVECVYNEVNKCINLVAFLFAAGESDSACNELQQLRDDGADSLEQSLVRRGEMTPFGTMMNNSAEVNSGRCLTPLFIQTFLFKYAM